MTTRRPGQQQRQPLHQPEIPDGGYGWVCVLAQFMVNGFTWGTVASYAVYLAFYLSHSLFPSASALDFALLGGLNFAVAVLTAPFATLAARLAGVRAPMAAGCVFLPAGFVTASFASKVWHLYLSQGVLVGLGVGLVYIPATAVIPQWFSVRRSLANGICAAGSGIGGLAMSFATEGMLKHLGLAWALRITAIVVFVVNALATILVRSRNQEIQPSQRVFDFQLLASYHVKLLLLWSFTIMFGYITLMFSLPDYALTIGRSSADSATVAAVLNLGTVIGRPAIGFASDRYGRIEVAALLTLVCGVLCFAMWIPATVYPVLILFALLSGAILGIFWAAIAPLAAEVVDLKEVPSMLSLTWIAVAAPAAVAEVIALQLRRPQAHRVYMYPQIFAGVSYLLAACIIFELCRSVRKSRGESATAESPSPEMRER